MRYYVFTEDKKGEEKMVAATPDLEIAREVSLWLCRTDTPEREVVSATLCLQKMGSEMEKLEIYQRGSKDPQIL